MIDLSFSATKFQLMTLLGMDGLAYFMYMGEKYILKSIERESGSGKHFNLYVVRCRSNKQESIFIRTTD